MCVCARAQHLAELMAGGTNSNAVMFALNIVQRTIVQTPAVAPSDMPATIEVCVCVCACARACGALGCMEIFVWRGQRGGCFVQVLAKLAERGAGIPNLALLMDGVRKAATAQPYGGDRGVSGGTVPGARAAPPAIPVAPFPRSLDSPEIRGTVVMLLENWMHVLNEAANAHPDPSKLYVRTRARGRKGGSTRVGGCVV